MTDLPDPSSPKIQKTHEGEHHGDFGDIPIKLTSATYKFALCAAVNSCNLGYDIGVSTEAGRLLQTDLGLSRVEREVFIGSLNFWAMFGAMGAQYFTDKWGRRRTFVVAAVGFIFGIILTILSQSYTLLMIGRLFVGLGVGVGLAIDPLYIAEITPAKYRGELVTWSEIATNVGIVFGFTTGLFLGGLDDGAEWRVMFLLGCIMPVVMIILVFTVMPESPRWLVSKGQDDEAREILTKIYPSGYDIGPVLQDIQEAIDRDAAAEKAVGWGVVFRPTPAFKRMLLVGVGTAIAQQAVGIDAIQYYLLDIIEESGIESDKNQTLVLVLLGVIKLVFIVIGGKCFDRRGRRSLFFVSLIGMTAALLLVGIAKLINSGLSTGAQVTGLALYLAFFSTGMGPGAWLIPSEVFSVSIRAKAMSIATTLNRATATLMASTFLSTAHAIGFGAFFCLLGIICIIVLAFLYFYLPETKGRSLEDMAVYFAEITGDRNILDAEAELVQRRPEPQPGGSAGDQGLAPQKEGEVL
ncbi:hypothetical protein ACA910_001330 [Epithemia clementina (nom. ined.)]